MVYLTVLQLLFKLLRIHLIMVIMLSLQDFKRLHKENIIKKEYLLNIVNRIYDF